MRFFRAIAAFRQKTRHQKILLLTSLWTRIKSRLYYPTVFASFGRGSLLFHPLLLHYPEYIHIGNAVVIREGSRLETVPVNAIRRPELIIGNSVNIEQNVHIVCHHRVVIGNNVSITANCAIVDATHPFDDLPQDVKVGATVQDDDGYVEIGEGTFIGIGCVVLPNVRIGKWCVVGANSVVTRSIPDYCVAAGAPAVVLRTIRKIPNP